MIVFCICCFFTVRNNNYIFRNRINHYIDNYSLQNGGSSDSYAMTVPLNFYYSELNSI